MPDLIRVLELRSVRGTGGGPEKTILLGTEKTDRSRFAVTVCYIRDLRDDVFGIDQRATRHDIDYVEVRERNSFDPTIWRSLRQLVAERQIDIVHAHEYKTDFLAWLLGRRTGILPLATAHGWTGQSLRERALYYPLDKKLLARLPRVIAVSSEIRDVLVRAGARPDRVTVILNSIDPVVFRRDPEKRGPARASIGFDADAFIIGAVGRLERQKRFDLMIEAFARLVSRRPNLALAIVGDGSLVAELRAVAARCGVSGRCRFLGHRDDVAYLHNGFDLFVQSSEYEGTPNAILEAMALETPIVATDVGGSRELALPDVHALIVPPHDVEKLATAVEIALADPATTRARAVAARRRIEGDLSFDVRTRRLEQIYEELITARAARAFNASYSSATGAGNVPPSR